MLVQSTVRFASAIILALTALALASCNRQAEATAPEPASPAEGAPATALSTAANRIRPAVVVLASFDEHGALVANEQGFFISADGDLLVERTAMNNASSAVVKTADGHAYDIFGAYVRSAAPNFILLKTNAHNVPHLNSPITREMPEGAAAAIVLGAGGSAQTPTIEGTITGRKRDETGEWLNFEPPPPNSALGAPVIDDQGMFIGIVALRNEKGAPAIFRSGGAYDPLVAQTAPPEIALAATEAVAAPKARKAPTETDARNIPAPPRKKSAENTSPREVANLAAPPPTPKTKGFFIKMNPNWHIHAKDRPPSPSPE